MNSRQRRKLAAAKHNALRIEEEAYREDRVRDPDKYRWRASKSTARNAAVILALGAGMGL
jgi:hypothetical protein